MARRSNEGTVPVLLMNPREDMAARRRTRRTARKTTPTRRRRRAPTRRRRTTTRRRRNPKMDLMGTLIAGLGGATMGGAAYALEGPLAKANLEPWMVAAITGGSGLALGALVSMWHKQAGAGVAGGGMALAAKQAIDMFYAKQQTQGMGQIPAYAYQKFGATPSHAAYQHLPNPSYATAQLDAVGADLGAVQAQLDAVEAQLY